MIEVVELPQEQPNSCAAKVYDPADYGGLAEEDWLVPIGTVWKGSSLELRFNRSPDTVCGTREAYLLCSQQSAFPNLKIYALDMLGSAGDVRAALGLPVPVVGNGGPGKAGRELKGSLNLVIGACQGGATLRQRGARHDLAFTGADADELLNAFTAGAAHVARHYYRITYGGDARLIEVMGKVGVARVRGNSGCRDEYWSAVRDMLSPKVLSQMPVTSWAVG